MTREDALKELKQRNRWGSLSAKEVQNLSPAESEQYRLAISEWLNFADNDQDRDRIQNETVQRLVEIAGGSQ